MLRSRALDQPGQTAHTFLVDGEFEEVSVTYGELDRQARSIASRLQSLKFVGERALLIYPPGLEYISAFFGCLYSGVIAAPAPSASMVGHGRWLERIRSIVRNAEPVVCLTTANYLTRLERLFEQAPDLRSIRCLVTDHEDFHSAEEWLPGRPDCQALAYLQYTSGSTSDPKGVMVTHENVLQNLEDMSLRSSHTPESVVVSWLPHFHDMGLVYGNLMPVYCGGAGYLMNPASFIQQPLRWLRAISRYRGTHAAAPNFAYELCVAKFKPERCAGMDLSSWLLAINGAEPIRRATIERFSETFAPYHFRRNAFCLSYGLAEATLMVSAEARQPVFYSVSAAELERGRAVEADENGGGARSVVGCGYKASSVDVAIVDPTTLTRCPPGAVGEIWVAGPSVAPGYWERPDETEAVFKARLADTNEGPFLRTGDLGFLNRDILFVTGRIKDMIIVDGRNHYPQDIEQTAEQSHFALRKDSCAAFSVDVDLEERLVIVAEVEHRHKLRHTHAAGRSNTSAVEPLAAEVERELRRAVTEGHEIKVHAVVLLKAGAIPKTSSGKIRRRDCRTQYLAGLLEMWSEQE
jgi:acyl-CoA synthetase (AMP-forming)/AMP-acid ligase II